MAFLTFIVAFCKFSFRWLGKHINSYNFGFCQILLGPPCNLINCWTNEGGKSSAQGEILHRAAETVEMEKTSQGFWRVPWEQAHWELWNEPPLDRSGLTSQIPFMASLWIRSGYDMKVGKSAETYQVGAHFKALIKAILVAPSRNLEKFFSFHVSLPRCVSSTLESELKLLPFEWIRCR